MTVTLPPGDTFDDETAMVIEATTTGGFLVFVGVGLGLVGIGLGVGVGVELDALTGFADVEGLGSGVEDGPVE